jgi:hypothetical protein
VSKPDSVPQVQVEVDNLIKERDQKLRIASATLEKGVHICSLCLGQRFLRSAHAVRGN